MRIRMVIEIINTGSELLLGFVLNTHQQWLCRELADRGYVVSRQVAISDSAADIKQAVSETLPRANLIITTGGLGPTSDDITRDMIAALFGKKLIEDASVVASIEDFFAIRKRPMPAKTRVQALVPEGATVLPNANGTAPGLAMQTPRGWLVMLPGPPRELRPMFTNQVVPLLEKLFPKPSAFVCRVLKTTGVGESVVEEKVEPLLGDLFKQGLEIGYCARVGEVDVRLVGHGSNAAELVDEAENIIRHKMGSFVFGLENESLEAVIVRMLTERKQTLALAESCTGGFIANRITNVPGSSAVFLAGLVTYSNVAKRGFLGVNAEILAANGAVSEPVAREMAEGARNRTGSNFALSVTGIAGPTGGTPEKPVGTVFIGLARNGPTIVKQFHNNFDRETFKFTTSQQALDMLRWEIQKLLARKLN
jgi:nicotinamide-nucleotide amidase